MVEVWVGVFGFGLGWGVLFWVCGLVDACGHCLLLLDCLCCLSFDLFCLCFVFWWLPVCCLFWCFGLLVLFFRCLSVCLVWLFCVCLYI